MAFKLKGTGLYKYTAGKNGGSFKHTAKFGETTSINEMDAVEKHNKRHQKGDTHAPGTYSGRKDFHGNAGEWNAKKEGGDKPVAKKHHSGMKKHKPAHKKAGRDKFTEGTIPAHVKKAFPNLTLEAFNKDKQGYNKKATAKLKAGNSKPAMTKYKK